MQNKVDNGLVIRVTGHEVWVDIGGEMLPCLQRGRMRRQSSRRIVAGDRVTVSLPGPETELGSIEAIAPRSSWLSRWVERSGSERMIVANVARLYVVTSLQEPPVHNAFIDRVLVSAERGKVKSSVVLNKMDLIDSVQAAEFAAVYESCGYPVVRTSAVTGDGTEVLADELQSDVYAFVGVSGVGKSSLLNRMDPALDIKTREVGEKTGRGRHTTTNSQLYRFREGWLADTPGVQIFGFAGADRSELAGCFPEMRRYEGECRFSPCMHSHEPGCAVKDALDGGAIPASRYQSYLKILAEIDEREKRRR